jgi:hypothetical protein
MLFAVTISKAEATAQQDFGAVNKVFIFIFRIVMYGRSFNVVDDDQKILLLPESLT